MPDSRIPIPLVLSDPCTDRKSVTFGLRLEACWMATLSPMFLIPPTSVMTTKTGNSAQNPAPNVRSNPGNPPPGMPAHRASITL